MQKRGQKKGLTFTWQEDGSELVHRLLRTVLYWAEDYCRLVTGKLWNTKPTGQKEHRRGKHISPPAQASTCESSSYGKGGDQEVPHRAADGVN